MSIRREDEGNGLPFRGERGASAASGVAGAREEVQPVRRGCPCRLKTSNAKVIIAPATATPPVAITTIKVLNLAVHVGTELVYRIR